MPTDTVVVVALILAAFAFFAGTLTYADLTWNRNHKS
jgi:hypothetical protein